MALNVATQASLERFRSTGSANTISRNRLAREERSKVLFGETSDDLLRPEQPKSFAESGISYRVLEGLILKTIKQEGPSSENQLSELLRVGISVFRELLHSLHKRELLDTPEPMIYDLTNRGRELTALVEQEDGYVGPAPVSFDDYCAMVRRQAEQERRVSFEEVEAVFADYPMREELKHTLREGFNSQRVMLFYGPPGNGKSLITDRLHHLLKEPVLLPYAFEFNSKVVRVYDPAYHSLHEEMMKREEEKHAHDVGAAGRPDRRWLISRAPLVTVGTEFKIEHFEIPYDGQYFAPPHIKANNGIFIFDDLGRQEQDHNMILNQFIYPLEQRESLIRFSGGSTLKAPFLQRLFLSTNLNHEEIIDDAFKRRLLYQILVDRPTEELWKEIFVNEALRNGSDQAVATDLSEKILHWYQRDGRMLRACDPRNMFTMLDATTDIGVSAGEVLSEESLRRIYTLYPAAYLHDAKYYVGAMDSVHLEERAL